MDIDLKVANIKDEFVDLFERNKEQICAYSPDFVNSYREPAIESFRKIGLPDKKNEDYKYTDLKKLFTDQVNHSFAPKRIEFDIEDIFTCDIPELDTEVLLVLNGFYYNPETELVKTNEGIIYGSMNAASKEYPELFEKHYAKYANTDNDPLASLNTAFAQDGVFLYVPENAKTERPLQIIHLLLSDKSLMVQHRNLFILEKNSTADIIICDHTLSTDEYITNSVTEMFAGENSVLDLTRVQNEHNGSRQLTNSFIHQEKNSNVSTNYITLHGGLVRNNVNVSLTDENCNNNTLGLFLADKDQHIDNFVYINHKKPHCISNQLFKGILDDKATGAFNGRIHVWPDAQKTEAYQANNNILLTNDAKMNSKPQLEIYADDVKCSHGGTSGQLNKNALFYLRSRGIPHKEAQLLLMYAFAHEIIGQIKIQPLQERIHALVEKRLRGELSRCNYCEVDCNKPGKN